MTISAPTKLDVPACDDYVARFRACVQSMGERDRLAHEGALLQQMATWAAAKADPKLAGSLADECAAAAAAARATTRVIGCVWREGDKKTPEIPAGGKPKPRGDRTPERDLLDPFE